MEQEWKTIGVAKASGNYRETERPDVYGKSAIMVTLEE